MQAVSISRCWPCVGREEMTFQKLLNDIVMEQLQKHIKEFTAYLRSRGYEARIISPDTSADPLEDTLGQYFAQALLGDASEQVEGPVLRADIFNGKTESGTCEFTLAYSRTAGMSVAHMDVEYFTNSDNLIINTYCGIIRPAAIPSREELYRRLTMPGLVAQFRQSTGGQKL